MECSTLDGIDEESLGKYLIDIYVKEDGQAIMKISLGDLEKSQLKSNYNDLLWTMENGFSEVGKVVDNRSNSEKLQDITLLTKEDIEDSRTNSEKLQGIKWTKENLEQWKFITSNNQTKMKFENISITLQGENMDCGESDSSRSWSCDVAKVDKNYIYWTWTLSGTRFGDPFDYAFEEVTHLKTQIDTGKTIIIKKEPEKCYSGSDGRLFSCPK